jgi:phosphoribosylformylglycinamidine (FGAM) synthase-like enzyme
MLQNLAAAGLINSATDVGSGGLAVTLAKAALANQVGVEAWLHADGGDESVSEALFAENTGSVVITCNPKNADAVTRQIERDSSHYVVLPIGKTIADRVEIKWEHETVISATLSDLHAAFSSTLESQLAAEVVKG